MTGTRWTFKPGDGAPETGVFYRVSLDGEDFGPWIPMEDAIAQSDRCYSALSYAASTGEDDPSDEAALQLCEGIADMLSLGSVESEDLVTLIIVDMAVDGESVLTVQAVFDWSVDEDGHGDPIAGPKAFTQSPDFRRIAADLVSRVELPTTVDFERIPF